MSLRKPNSFEKTAGWKIVDEAPKMGNLKEKSVLVTGGAGYVGTTLVPKLLATGCKVRILDPLLFGNSPLISIAQNKNLEVLKGRVENRQHVQLALKGVNAVVHLADLANDPACDLNPRLSWKIVHEGTKILVEEAKRQGVERLVFASSASVYGASDSLNKTEESKLNPLSLYSKLKAKNEQHILSQVDKDFSACCLRKSTIYGYSPRLRLDLVVNTLTANAVRTGQITIFGGKQWRPNVHVSDACDAYLTCLNEKAEKISGQIFNVGCNEQNYTILEIGNLVKQVLPETKVMVQHSPDRRSYHLCFDKIRKQLGFKPKFALLDGIEEIKRVFENNAIANFKDPVYYNVAQMKATGFVDDS